ncbi:hypothetical protein VTO42DRAFT_3274 [Malbranchea cinnamomea]
MPRAEVGTTKYISNKLKAKGLQRLRWYCQVCQRQMRDENGFKCHTQSESHVRQMLIVGEDPKRYIKQYSEEFLRDFLKLLKTSHGEKQVHINHFYQEYIANKDHIHMNATQWSSLTEFAKYLGREGICRVEEGEKGIFISWIDNSPEALRRREALRRKERLDRGDEELEQKMIEEQVKRAQRDKEAAGREDEEVDEKQRELQREEGSKIKLNFVPKSNTESKSASPSEPDGSKANPAGESGKDTTTTTTPAPDSSESTPAPAQRDKEKASIKLGIGNSKPKNVFAAAAKKNGPPKKKIEAPPKPLSATERIIKEDMERKRARESGGFTFNMKRQRIT